jgi:LemA protein
MSFPPIKITAARAKFVSGLIFFCAIAWYLTNQYNRLLVDDERVVAEWGLVINQYQRRADLVPSLVAVVKTYAAHESKLLNEIAEARAKVMGVRPTADDARDPEMLEQFQTGQKQLAGHLFRLLMVAENYPELKANQLFQDLMVQLEGTENRIAYARQRYILAVAEYNMAVRHFPGNLLAMVAGYKTRMTFTVENMTEIATAPKADLK